jgi:hypothetical protein
MVRAVKNVFSVFFAEAKTARILRFFLAAAVGTAGTTGIELVSRARDNEKYISWHLNAILLKDGPSSGFRPHCD